MAKFLDHGLLHERWYRVFDTDDAGALLLKTAQEAIQDNYQRRGEARTFASLFEGLELTSFEGSGYHYDNNEVFPGLEELPVIKNTVRSIGMTQVAMLTANDTPLAQFMSNAGGWDEQTKTVRMGRLVDVEVEQPQGQFATLHELHRHGATLAINCTGTYMVFFFPGDDGVRAELDDSLSVGIEMAGRFGRITSLVRTVWRDADELVCDFPDFEDEIYEQDKPHFDGSLDTREDGDLRPRRGVKVVQGWHCQYKDKVGREMWVLEDGMVLKDDDFDRKYPPMVKWDYERQLYGAWGVPMTRSIYEMAVRENRMLCDMDNAERNSPQCCIVLPRNAEQEGDLDEARGWAIIRSNVDPKMINFVAPPKYNEMTAAFVDRMAAGCQDISGVSNQHSAAVKQQGTTSGKHEHLVAALHSERFADQERRLIQCRAVDTAKQIVRALKLVVEQEPDFKRMWSKGDKSEEIRAADLDLDVSKYTIVVAPVSEDKDTPKARLDKAEDWLNQGLITGTEYASLQETYATQEKSALLLAQEQWLEKQIDKWLHASEEDRLDENFYQGPNRWIDLPAALRHVSMAQLQARSPRRTARTSSNGSTSSWLRPRTTWTRSPRRRPPASARTRLVPRQSSLACRTRKRRRAVPLQQLRRRGQHLDP
jgi:hypothetical protein